MSEANKGELIYSMTINVQDEKNSSIKIWSNGDIDEIGNLPAHIYEQAIRYLMNFCKEEKKDYDFDKLQFKHQLFPWYKQISTQVYRDVIKEVLRNVLLKYFQYCHICKCMFRLPPEPNDYKCHYCKELICRNCYSVWMFGKLAKENCPNTYLTVTEAMKLLQLEDKQKKRGRPKKQ
jgi:hypothetical protein